MECVGWKNILSGGRPDEGDISVVQTQRKSGRIEGVYESIY